MRSGADRDTRDRTLDNDKLNNDGVPGPARWASQHKPIETRLVYLRWRRRFAGVKQHVSDAREFVESLLADCPADQDAAWIVGELATNAILYSRTGLPGGSFEVEVARGHRWVQVCLIDQGGDGHPVIPAKTADELPEGGLGLYGISMLVSRYGTYLTQDGQRVVWARLLTEPRATVGTE